MEVKRKSNKSSRKNTEEESVQEEFDPNALQLSTNEISELMYFYL